MTHTHYNLLGKAFLESRHGTTAVNSELSARLGNFATDSQDYSHPKADIVTRPFSSGIIRELPSDHLLSRRKFTIVEIEGESAAVFPYRSRPDIILVFSQPMTVWYSPRPAVASKLVDTIMYCLQLVLLRGQSMFFHGAAVQKEECTVLLTGLQGARKTLVLLNLLRQGWDFMADDRVILANNKIHLFSDKLPLMPHHFAALPWLAQQGEKASSFATKAKRLKSIAKWCESNLPSYLLPPLIQYYDQALMLHPHELFPACITIQEARPDNVIMMVGGSSVSAATLTADRAAPLLATICDIEFFPFARLEHELFVRGVAPRAPSSPLLAKQLTNSVITQIRINDQETIEETTEMVLKCLPIQ